jgi:hypothetical protein
MRPEEQWPGREGDDTPRHGIAALTARGPQLATDGGKRVMPGLPSPQQPIDATWEEIPLADGSVVIRMGGPELLNADEEPDDQTGTYDADFYANLAERMDDADLAIVAEELLEGIEADIQSRSTWIAGYERGMSILGIELKQPKAEATGEGVSVVDHPLLLEATILYQSNASAELLPAAGPVKIDNGGQSTAITDEDAQQLEKDMNQYLTVHRPEYVPDTERMIYQQGFGGMGVKKIFHCPLRRAPVSDAIAPGDFIVSNTATSLENCGRKTHRIKMRPAVMARMQYVGAYRDVDLQTPVEDITGIERKTAQVHGIKPNTDRQQDVDYTLYECCCEVDMPGDRHMERGKPTGLPRPYIVTVEKDTRQILEIRRNWVDGDDLFTERRRFSVYPFVPMFGFYASGLLTILGNTTSALTAGWRIMLDKGMFSNFPGGMYAVNGDRQMDNNFRAAPGEFVKVDISGFDDIRKVVAPYPYTEPGASTQAFFEKVETTGQRVGGAASIPVAEGRADAPVGTVLAALEQTYKMLSAVHRRSHQAQSVEFQILLELIREKPEDFVKYFERDGFWTISRLMRAVDNWSLIPRADPNTPTQMHRLIKMMAVKQLQQLAPDQYDGRKVDELILRTIGIDDPQELMVPPAAPGAMPPDPTLAVANMVAQTEAMKAQSKERIELGKGQLKMLELQGKQQTEIERLQVERDKIDAQLTIAREKETGTTERELFKAGMQMEGQQLDQQHQAEAAERDREHQASEGEASRKQAVQLAKMKPKPSPGGKK